MGKPRGFVPGALYSGHNGQVLLYDTTITISRDGFGGRLSGTPTVTFSRHELVTVQHKTPSRLVNGWVRLVHARSGEPSRFEYQDPDLVLYTWQQREHFTELLERLASSGPSSLERVLISRERRVPQRNYELGAGPVR